MQKVHSINICWTQSENEPFLAGFCQKRLPSFRQGLEDAVNHFDHFIRINQGHCIRMMNPQVIIFCFRARQVLVEGFVVFVHAILLLHVGPRQERVRHCVKTYHRSPQGSCHVDATGVRSYKQIDWANQSAPLGQSCLAGKIQDLAGEGCRKFRVEGFFFLTVSPKKKNVNFWNRSTLRIKKKIKTNYSF